MGIDACLHRMWNFLLMHQAVFVGFDSKYQNGRVLNIYAGTTFKSSKHDCIQIIITTSRLWRTCPNV